MTNLRRNIYAALLGALALAVMMIPGFALIPTAGFLKYEPSGVIILMAAAMIGLPGCALACFVKDGLFWLFGLAHPLGALSDFINTASFALVTGYFLKKGDSTRTAVIAYLIGTAAATLVMIPANIVILNLEFGMSFEKVMSMMLPAILPFNLAKGILNSIVFHFLGRSAAKRVLKAHQLQKPA